MNERLYQDDIVSTMRELGWQVQEHNDRVSSHIPDLSFSAEGLNGWAEIKLFKGKVMKRLNFKTLNFTTGQQKFLLSTAIPAWLIIGHWDGKEMIHHILPASEFKAVERKNHWIINVMRSKDLFTLLDHAMAVSLRDHMAYVR